MDAKECSIVGVAMRKGRIAHALIECSFPSGHTEVVSHLVNKCNRSVDLDARNALGFTPLMKAALQGRTKIAKILLFAGGWTGVRGIQWDDSVGL